MQNLGNVYIYGSPFVMSRTDTQNGLDMVFKFTSLNCGESAILTCPKECFDVDRGLRNSLF
jgi:hypothetical protein